MQSWKVTAQGEEKVLACATEATEARVALSRNFEFRLPLAWLQAAPLDIRQVRSPQNADVTTRLRLRFSLWASRLPVDALPVEGWIELELLHEGDLIGQ